MGSLLSKLNPFTGKLQKLFGKVFSQNNVPTLNTDKDAAIWVDTDDSNKVYLLYRRGSGDQVACQLTVSSFSSSSSSVSSSSSSSSSSSQSSFSTSSSVSSLFTEATTTYYFDGFNANVGIVFSRRCSNCPCGKFCRGYYPPLNSVGLGYS